MRAQPSGLCFAHDPASRARAQEARRRGGQQSRGWQQAEPTPSAGVAVALPDPAADLREYMLAVCRAVEAGQIDPRRADAITAAARVAVRVPQRGDENMSDEELLSALDAEAAAVRARIAAKAVAAA